MNALLDTVNEMQEILGICPCCGELFRLVEAKFLFETTRAKTCEYLDLIALERKISDQDERLFAAEERFAQKLRQQREALILKGRRKAKKHLRRIDPVFCARGIDPQDVKVIFEPVEYVIFHGLASAAVNCVEFVSRAPETQSQEITVNTIDRAIRSGNVEFETLHLRQDGSLEVRKAATRQRRA